MHRSRSTCRHESLGLRLRLCGRLALAAEEARSELPRSSRIDADLLQHLVDERRLRAEAEGRVHDLIGEAAAVVARGTVAAAPAQAIDMQDLDALRSLPGLHLL